MFSLLLVEDDEALGKELRCFFLNFFDTVTLCTCAKDALFWLEENTADVIVSDICMPEIDGLSFLQQVRKNNPEKLLIVISAHPETEYFLQSITLGIYRFFIKPFDTEKLIEEMHALVSLLRRRQEEVSHVQIGKGIAYDLQTKSLFANGLPCLLPKKEKQLLHLLVLNRHQYLSEEAISKALWEDNYVPSSTIRALVCRLRERLGKEDALQNYRGYGYRLTCSPLDSTPATPMAD